MSYSSVSNSDTSYSELALITQAKGLVPQDCPDFRCQSQVATLQAVLLTNQLQIGSSHDPFLRFDDLVGQLIEFRKVLYLLLLVYYKRYN